MTEQEKNALEQLTKRYKEDYQPATEQSWQRLQAAMLAKEQPMLSVSKPPQPRSGWYAIAASFLFLLGATALYFALTSDKEQHYLATHETLFVSLADGTKVSLKKGSELSLAAGYGAVNRELRLQGEAFFDVVPNAALPLRLRDGQTTLEVVGTSFNLVCEASSGLMEVEVASGKVLLATYQDTIAVKAFEVGRYEPSKGLQQQAVEHLNRQAWRTKTLQFEAEPLSVVLEMVGRAYDVQILADPTDLARCDFPLTASFDQIALTDLLEELSRFTNGRFEKLANEHTYRITDWCL